MMNFRLARPAHLVDVGCTRARCDTSEGEARASHIGALTTHLEVEIRPALVADFEVLSEAMRWVGHYPIRTRGTVGGSIAHGDATAEWCLLAVLLDAVIVVEGPRAEVDRSRPGDVVLRLLLDRLGVRRDDRRDRIPPPGTPRRDNGVRRTAGRLRDRRRRCFDLDLRGGEVVGGRVALGGVGATPVRSSEAERVLAAGGTFDDCAEAAADALELEDDGVYTADYRRTLVRTLVARACGDALLSQGVST